MELRVGMRCYLTRSPLGCRLEAKPANKGRIETTGRDAGGRTQQKSLRAFVGGEQGLCDAAPARAIAAAAALETKVRDVTRARRSASRLTRIEMGRRE